MHSTGRERTFRKWYFFYCLANIFTRTHTPYERYKCISEMYLMLTIVMRRQLPPWHMVHILECVSHKFPNGTHLFYFFVFHHVVFWGSQNIWQTFLWFLEFHEFCEFLCYFSLSELFVLLPAADGLQSYLFIYAAFC